MWRSWYVPLVHTPWSSTIVWINKLFFSFRSSFLNFNSFFYSLDFWFSIICIITVTTILIASYHNLSSLCFRFIVFFFSAVLLWHLNITQLFSFFFWFQEFKYWLKHQNFLMTNSSMKIPKLKQQKMLSTVFLRILILF